MPWSIASRAVAGAIVLVSLAQHPVSIWDGVYSAAQAKRGAVVYETRCSRCHGDDLNGVRGSALAGDGLMQHWEARTVARLFRKIRDTMPPIGGGTITDGDTLDVLAYVLQQNGCPEGAAELPPDPTVLAGIQITGRTGPTPARTGALVQVTGCLARDTVDDWQLTVASEPQMTALDALPQPDRQAAGAPMGGARTVRLLNVFPNPAPHAGHTMRATGFLIRDADGDRVNVVTLEMIDSRCWR